MKKRIWLLTCALLLMAGTGNAQTLQITQLEYFFDTDPGPGNGVSLSVTASDSINLTTNIPVPTNIGQGYHWLYVRSFYDSAGLDRSWSLTEAQQFYIPDSLVYAEYFFDTDPGQGQGTVLNLTNTSDSFNQNFTITAPTNLAQGIHNLYVRSRSQTGKWSMAMPVDFYMTGALAAGEYFFDTDPGFGAGTAFTFTPGDSVLTNLTVATSSLNGGEHRLYVRTRTNSGTWSHVDEAFFYLLPKVLKGEYYWDTDPGVGNGIALFNNGLSDSLNESYTLNAPCLTPGMHYLNVRTQDDQGKWSLVGTDSVTFANPSMTLAATYPGPGPFGTPVKLRADGGKTPYKYQLGGNVAGTDTILLAPNGTAVVFTATDSCGYTATSNLTTPAEPTDISLLPTASSSIALTGWDNWVYLLDGNSNIIGAIHDGRQDLGATTISYKHIEAPDTVRAFNATQAHYLDRNWYINSDHAPQQDVAIRLYGTDAEWARYQAVEPSVSQYNQLYLTKYNGPNEDLNYANNTVVPSNYRYFAPDSVGSFAGATTNGFHANYHIPGFSELYLNRDLAIPLSLSKIDVWGNPEKDRIRISWKTEKEESLLRYELVKQTGSGWEIVEKVPAQNKDSYTYNAFDEHPVSGKNIYQVRIVEANGDISYTPAVIVHYNAANTIAVFPNPATDYVQVNGLVPGAVLILADATGKTVSSQPVTTADNRISMEGLAAGLYRIIIRQPNGEQLQTPVLKK